MRTITLIIAATLATLFTRFIPLFIHKYFKDHPFLSYLSKVLPTASFGLLVVYSIKDVSFEQASTYLLFGCALLVVFLEYRFNKILLSIFLPTIIYVIFMNFIL